MFKLNLALLMCVLGVQFGISQQLISPSVGFTKKRTTFITLSDGAEISGSLKRIKFKKSLFKSVAIIDSLGKETVLLPTEIKHMYLPLSKMQNLANKLEFIENADKWTDEGLEQAKLTDGYAYFESSKVKIKKKEYVLMMQLLNPSFSKKIIVYNDPNADETASVGVGPVKAGGYEKSYYIKKQNESIAFLVEKKNYKKEFSTLWGDCVKLDDPEKKPNWKEFVDHLIQYSECN